jgi:hypothetical protein
MASRAHARDAAAHAAAAAHSPPSTLHHETCDASRRPQVLIGRDNAVTEMSSEPRPRAPDEEGPAGPLGADFIIPVLALALVAYYSVTTLGLAWEAKATGVFIAAVLVPLCAVHMIRMTLAISRGRGTFSLGDLITNTPVNRQRLGLVVLVAAFIATIQWIGTTLGLFLLLIGCMLLTGVRSIRALLGVAAATSAIVYVLLIHLLNSRLPHGPVERLLGSVLGG